MYPRSFAMRVSCCCWPVKFTNLKIAVRPHCSDSYTRFAPEAKPVLCNCHVTHRANLARASPNVKPASGFAPQLQVIWTESRTCKRPFLHGQVTNITRCYVKQRLFSGAFAKLRKASYCLCVRMEQLVSRRTDCHQIWHLMVFLKSVEKLWLTSKKKNKNKKEWVLYMKTYAIYGNISLNSF